MLATLVYLIVCMFVVAIAWWLIDFMSVPMPLNRWAKALVIIIGAIIIIGILFSLAGVNTGLPGLR